MNIKKILLTAFLGSVSALTFAMPKLEAETRLLFDKANAGDVAYFWDHVSQNSKTNLSKQLAKNKSTQIGRLLLERSFGIPSDKIDATTTKEFFSIVMHMDPSFGSVMSKIVNITQVSPKRAYVKSTRNGVPSVTEMVLEHGQWNMQLQVPVD